MQCGDIGRNASKVERVDLQNCSQTSNDVWGRDVGDNKRTRRKDRDE